MPRSERVREKKEGMVRRLILEVYIPARMRNGMSCKREGDGTR